MFVFGLYFNDKFVDKSILMNYKMVKKTCFAGEQGDSDSSKTLLLAPQSDALID